MKTKTMESRVLGIDVLEDRCVPSLAPPHLVGYGAGTYMETQQANVTTVYFSGRGTTGYNANLSVPFLARPVTIFGYITSNPGGAIGLSPNPNPTPGLGSVDGEITEDDGHGDSITLHVWGNLTLPGQVLPPSLHYDTLGATGDFAAVPPPEGSLDLALFGTTQGRFQMIFGG